MGTYLVYDTLSRIGFRAPKTDQRRHLPCEGFGISPAPIALDTPSHGAECSPLSSYRRGLPATGQEFEFRPRSAIRRIDRSAFQHPARFRPVGSTFRKTMAPGASTTSFAIPFGTRCRRFLRPSVTIRRTACLSCTCPPLRAGPPAQLPTIQDGRHRSSRPDFQVDADRVEMDGAPSGDKDADAVASGISTKRKRTFRPSTGNSRLRTLPYPGPIDVWCGESQITTLGIGIT